MKAPIHRWFRYPAGYSYKFVERSFQLFDLTTKDWVYDPFSGTGTTLVCAKHYGINAYGVEAHSFVHWVAQVKLFWEFDLDALSRTLVQIFKEAREYVLSLQSTVRIEGVFPDLIYKCYHPQDLEVLFLLREFIRDLKVLSPVRDFLRLALTDTLRSSAVAGTGWPYIAPRKAERTQSPKDAFAIFQKVTFSMLADLRAMVHTWKKRSAEIYNILGDSREHQEIPDSSVALALTSPPYLNNYDYADRTRLETYFWGIARSWGEITEKFRSKLMVAATTQVRRKDHDLENVLDETILEVAPEVYHTVRDAVQRLSEIRLRRRGKKDYDLMVALYFNDMLKVIQETYRVLKPGAHFCLVLGDSAPYGVHLQTGLLIGQLGIGIGFSDFRYEELRKRGMKWRNNPQRHNISLREGIVILRK